MNKNIWFLVAGLVFFFGITGAFVLVQTGLQTMVLGQFVKNAPPEVLEPVEIPEASRELDIEALAQKFEVRQQDPEYQAELEESRENLIWFVKKHDSEPPQAVKTVKEKKRSALSVAIWAVPVGMGAIVVVGAWSQLSIFRTKEPEVPKVQEKRHNAASL
jgi:hypothetical protein